MSDWKVFGERLKSELERQEISQRQLADKAGMPLATVCRYVHSQRVPRATEILRLAKILNVTCDYMLGLSDDPHKTRDGWTKGTPLHDSGTDYAHGFADGYKKGLNDAQTEERTEERTKTCDCIERQAVERLDWFTKLYCRDKSITDDLAFRCKQCEFEMPDKTCLVKVMARKLCPDYKGFGAMGDL